jgi:hypothetical protein
MKTTTTNARASPQAQQSQKKTTNYNLGSRNMTIAAKNALTRAGKSFSSVATISQRFSKFADFAKESAGVKIMEQVSRNAVLAYAKTLVEKVSSGELSPATAQNYLSAVNVVMVLARGDTKLRITAVGGAGLPSRTGIATTDKSVSKVDHDLAVGRATEPIAIMLTIQRELGLRFEESAKMDAVKAYAQAHENGVVTVSAGTKGGLSREVPITNQRQLQALKLAADFQSANQQKSMISNDQTYKDFRNNSYNEIRNLDVNFHGERHAYALSRYEKLMGAAAPVALGISKPSEHIRYIANQLGVPITLVKERDYQVRLQISHELGHGRVSVIRSYIG